MTGPGERPAAPPLREGARAAGRWLYRHRSLTPLPLVLLLLLFARPSAPSLAFGLPPVLLGETIRLAALRHIGGASRSTRMGAERLVDTGPYAWVRNPLYAGNLFLSAGLAVCSGVVWLPPLLLLLFVLQYGPIIAAEEEEMARRFPEEWPAYARRVPRILPGRPRVGGRGEPSGWTQAIRTERRSLTSVALLLGFLIFRLIQGRAAS
ncbi:MAG: isoprenylcysteine carboxylmethyltransferase family protein [Candidatus Eisenbacteria bacterium]|nr:isoprenylcysteine carboxylmethyltransferase family protein [Candidatus Eisenbacteria bacterium]